MATHPLRCLPASALLLCLLLAPLAAGAATHYPPGARCYDCHAISAAKMVAGTHLIKKSQRTVTLGLTAGAEVPCLYCHAKNATSIDSALDRMLAVDAHFDARSLSKHRTELGSTSAANATTFDCVDCHTGITETVVTDGAGNATIHGFSADWAVTNPLPVQDTLIGSPADTGDAALSTSVCLSTSCHLNGSTFDSTAGDERIARAAHRRSNAVVSLNDAAVAEPDVYCTRCHGKHNSPDGEALLVLKNDRNTPATADDTTVRLSDCDVCHKQDENGGLRDNYALSGHGKVGLSCETCHGGQHDADGDGQFEAGPRLESNLTDGGMYGALTSTFNTDFYSVCMSCHGGHALHTPAAGFTGTTDFPTATGRTVGCLDCHDHHGTTAADATAQNDTMIRRFLGDDAATTGTIEGEDTRLPDPTGTRAPYSGGWYVAGQTYGACDNNVCHDAMTGNLADANQHLGGGLASCASNGTGCHVGHEVADQEFFGAGGDCTASNCHDGTVSTFPPVSNAHPKHTGGGAGEYGYDCSLCHPVDHDGTATDLVFGGVAIAGGHSGASYTALSKTCNDTYCHAGATLAGRTPDWDDTIGGVCGDCHGDPGDSGRPDGVDEPAGGSHLTASHAIEPCTACHTHDGTDTTEHVNGPANANGDALVSTGGSQITAFSYGAANPTSPDPDGLHYSSNSCTPSCHGQGTWGGTGGCNFCHGYPPTADGGANDKHAAGVTPVDHEAISNDEGVVLMAKHNDCGFCHGVKDSGSGTLEAQDPAAIDGVYTYVVTVGGDHRDGSITMNDDNNAVATDDADYNSGSGGCGNAACHGDDAAHQLARADAGAWPSASTQQPRDIGPGNCYSCHGGGLLAEGNQNWWPDSQATNGAGYPNRNGGTKTSGGTGGHEAHVTRIAEVVNGVGAGLATTEQKNATCSWCHPAGGHTVGVSDNGHGAAPATLMDGTTYRFKDIVGDVNIQPSVVTQPADGQVSCASVDCHYSAAPPAADWYGPLGSNNCAYCHPRPGSPYVLGQLPDSHDKHMGELSDGGQNLNCTSCHQSTGDYAHQNGVIDFKASSWPHETDGDQSIQSGSDTGPKYGTGTAAGEYTTCANLYCHGDFDPANTGVGGGNEANAPNWFNTDVQLGAGFGDGACGTCHGDTAGADAVSKAWPRTDAFSESHNDHVGSNSSPECSACHDSDTNGAAVGQGTYRDGAAHANGSIQLVFDAASGETETVSYEGLTATYDDTVGNGAATGDETCSNIRCHNGVTTPAFDLSGGTNITCGDCHNTGGAGPLPSDAGTGRSHAFHADNDNNYAECNNCHGTVQGTYTATGGANHQDLVVNVASPGGGTYANDADPAGVNYVAGDGVDDGDCSATSCHGAGTPVWGAAGSVACGTCHGKTSVVEDRSGYSDGGVKTQGAPPEPVGTTSVTRRNGKHLQHVNLSYGLTSDACNLCHNGVGSGSGSHADQSASGGGLTADVAFNTTAAGAGATYSGGNCSGLGSNCHSGSAPWDSGASLACSACHTSGLNGLAPIVISGTNPHTDYNGATAGGGACEDCHAGHVGAAGTVTIPLPPANWDNPGTGATESWDMQARLGIAYTSHNGIALGGSQTSGSTEAETCWNCHDGNNVSEWGYNTKTNLTLPGFSTVWATFGTQHDGLGESQNYGWIYQSNYVTKVSNWTQGYWMSQYDSLLKKRIVSVHSASFDPAGQSSSVAANVNTSVVNRSSPTYEAVSYLRCSYCHDVHDTFGPNSKPWLRGVWIGNPYPPELPPRSTYTYTTRISVNPNSLTTPRALSTSRDKGGYFIDQNSGFPTNQTTMDTLAETSGLCTLCHGTDVDNMDFYTGSTLWRSTMVNGHSNSTLGGTRANARDLFNAARYGLGMAMQMGVPNTPWQVCPLEGSNCDTTYPQAGFVSQVCQSDCRNLRNSGWFGGPVNTTTRGGGDYADWYGAGVIGGMSATENMAHKFTCSKCHSPHATGLPALLIHSCIDAGQGNYTIRGKDETNLIANNCHRKTGGTPDASGWHKLSAGQ